MLSQRGGEEMQERTQLGGQGPRGRRGPLAEAGGRPGGRQDRGCTFAAAPRGGTCCWGRGASDAAPFLFSSRLNGPVGRTRPGLGFRALVVLVAAMIQPTQPIRPRDAAARVFTPAKRKQFSPKHAAWQGPAGSPGSRLGAREPLRRGRGQMPWLQPTSSV